MQFGNYYQTVPVTSDPPNAKVFVNGEEKGRTPEFLSLRRGEKTEFHLVFPKGTEVTSQAEMQYRWATSFGGGFFLFIYGAPIGWGVDYWTGTAFDFKDVMISMGSSAIKKPGIEPTQSSWVLPPPESSSEYLSQDMARILQKHLAAAYPHAQILDFDSHELQFYEAHWRYDNVPGDADLNRLLASLKVHYFVDSHIEEKSGAYHIHWELKDVYLKQTALSGDYVVSDDDLAQRPHRSFFERASRSIDILPDLVTLDLGSTTSTLAYDGSEKSNSKALSADDFIGSAAPYVSALGLGVATPANTKGGWHWSLEFVPSVQLVVRTESFPGLPEISSVRFERERFSAGFGPRAGVNNRFGFFYISEVPMVGWTHLKAVTADQNVEANEAAFHLATEVGYSRFLSDRINIQLFVKAVTEDTHLWQKTISEIVGRSVSVSDVSYTVYGVSLGYYFPEVKNWVR
jgi:hypothetical protein